MYETYPEYANLRVLKSDWGIAESAEALEAELDADWWAIVRREIPYSPHSDSHLVEVYVLVKKPYGKENFVAEGNGKILYVGQGRRRELVYGGQAGVGGAPVGRRFVIVETHPVKAFYLRHKGEGYRAFRYTTELHFQKDTRNKLDVQQFLQMHMADVHPVFTPAYFARLVELVKGEKDSAQAVQERLLLEFRKPIAAFKKLQAVENEERARMETQRRAQEEQDKRELEARAYTPPPQAEPSFVPPPAAFGAPPLPGGPAPVPAPAPAAGSPDLLDFARGGGSGGGGGGGSGGGVAPAPAPKLSTAGSGGSSSVGARSTGGPSWIDFDAVPNEQDRKKDDIMSSFHPAPVQ